MDLETIEVANDEQRRAIQIFTVLEQLLIGGLEVFVFAFIFPGEKAAHPDVGETVTSRGLGDAFFKGVRVAFLIDFGWGGLAENFAESDEVLLRRAAFGKG